MHLRATGWPGIIRLALLVYVIAGLAALAVWQFTGNVAWVVRFFTIPSAILLVAATGLQLWLCRLVCREFSPGEPMLLVWQLIAVSAVFDLAGTLAIQVLGTDTLLNPLTYLAWWSRQSGQAIGDVGHVLQGPFRLLLLSAGLLCLLRLYRESGFLGGLRAVDWLLVLASAAYCAREAFDLVTALRAGKQPGWAEIMQWAVDPTLCLLLTEALLIHRSVQSTGIGLVGRCWRTFSSGIILILLGNALGWATAYGYLPWPYSALAWYVWMPAAAAFALAPAYQLEAIQWATSNQEAPAV